MVYLKLIVISILLFFSVFYFSNINSEKENSPKNSDKIIHYKPHQIKVLLMQPIATGLQNLLLISNQKLYTAGKSAKGLLGHGKKVSYLASPKEVDSGLKSGALSVSAGDHHNLVLTMNGKLYSFGRGQQGQLGHGDILDRDLLKQIATHHFDSKIMFIAAGGSHSIALTSKGSVYAFGKGDYGQLGSGDNENKTTPIKIESSYFDSAITRASCGKNHTVLISKKGSVYVFGEGGYGQLGLGDTKGRNIPHQIDSSQFDDKVTRLATGDNHTLIITAKGSIYSFGKGDFGQLGHGDKKNQLTPKQVNPNYFNGQVVRVAGGKNHSFFITQHRIAYTSGDGTDGQLGHLNNKQSLEPKAIDPLLYDGPIAQIIAKNNHSVLRTTKGNIYIFGDKSFLFETSDNAQNQYTLMELQNFKIN